MQLKKLHVVLRKLTTNFLLSCKKWCATWLWCLCRERWREDAKTRSIGVNALVLHHPSSDLVVPLLESPWLAGQAPKASPSPLCEIAFPSFEMLGISILCWTTPHCTTGMVLGHYLSCPPCSMLVALALEQGWSMDSFSTSSSENERALVYDGSFVVVMFDYHLGQRQDMAASLHAFMETPRVPGGSTTPSLILRKVTCIYQNGWEQGLTEV